MLVYDDPVAPQDARSKLKTLADRLSFIAAMSPGIERHAMLVGELIEGGELLQGMADARFAAARQDNVGTIKPAEWWLLLRLAAAVRISWQSSFVRLPILPPVNLEWRLPEEIFCKRAEGFAFYSLYPESYLEAAGQSRLDGSVRVVGLRSIGVPLAAIVATALGASAPVTLRPVGHPFRREFSMSNQYFESLARGVAGIAIVDEGPGLSGSSMGGLADRLEDAGVSPNRLHFFPSHAGSPGAEALPRHRERWQQARRHTVDFDALALTAKNPAHRLSNWVSDLTGPATSGLQDIGGGAWRARRYRDEAQWPPVNPQQERRKYLLEAEGRSWLLKFVGLGREGARKTAMAQRLSEADLIPEVAGCRHGFLIQRWLDLPETSAPTPLDTETVARYLGFRVKQFASDEVAGASLQQLWDMACHNVAEALDEPSARALRRRQPDLCRLEQRRRLVATDNRMHVWEWLRRPDGRLLKADAVDHHAAHDLIGCQDIAWDLVGAQVELDIDAESLDRMMEAESGLGADPRLLAAYTPCYLAFQIGMSVSAAQGCMGWPEEAARLDRQTARYAAMLRALIAIG